MKIESYLVKYILTLEYEENTTIETFYSEEDLIDYINKYNITNDINYDLRCIENYRILES